MMLLWKIVSVPFWFSGAMLMIAALRAATRKGGGGNVGTLVIDMIAAGVVWYVAARIAGA